MKILFLDIDSVMTVWDYTKADPELNKFDMAPFTPECVEALNEIITKTDCEIVLSSDHRWNHEFDKLKEIFYFNGCIKSPISITPLSKAYNSLDLDNLRAAEIVKWFSITFNQIDISNIEKWVAVDDLDLDKDDFKQDMENHFVQCMNGIHLVKDKIIDSLK